MVLREGAGGTTLAEAATRVTNAGIEAKGKRGKRPLVRDRTCAAQHRRTYWAHYLRAASEGQHEARESERPVRRVPRPPTAHAVLQARNYTLHITMNRRYDKNEVRLQATVYTYLL